MSVQGEMILLRAYLRNADRAPLAPTHQRLVQAARHEGLAGATVLHGVLGLGHGGLAKASRWSLFQRMPVIVEIVDSAERIARFLETSVPRVMRDGMITLERAHVMLYRHRHHESPVVLRLASELPPLSTVPHLEGRGAMKVKENGVLVRVFIGESDVFEHRPLHEAILAKVRELGLAGATVLRGVEGFGARSVVHKAQLLEMSTDLPIVIEIVDEEEKINRLLPHLETMVQEGMITMEYVVILLYRHDRQTA